MTIPNEVDIVYRVYGDNILECLTLIEWLNQTAYSGFVKLGETGPLDRKIHIYRSQNGSTTYAFQLCPYYGGTGRASLWPLNPLENYFAEKPDVVVTRLLESGLESKPVLAIEFCDALQAGNQAWQRFRRAYDAALARIPYFYVLPLIGWERDSGGLTLKGARYQNAQITLAQLALSSKYGTPSLQLYTKTSWTRLAEREGLPLPVNRAEFANISHAVRYAGALLRHEDLDSLSKTREMSSLLTPIFEGMLQVARVYGKYKSTQFTIHTQQALLRSADDIEKAAKTYADATAVGKPVEGEYALHSIDNNDLQRFGTLFYKDAQSSTTTERFREGVLSWLNWKDSNPQEKRRAYLELWGVTVPPAATSMKLNELAQTNIDKLPVSYKTGKAEAVFVQNRLVLRNILGKAYPGLSREILDWIEKDQRNRPLLTIPLYGYKPTGDSRPDRGLLPNLAALFPDLTENKNILVIMYSVNTPKNWRNLLQQQSNELWNVIRHLAGAIIVDVTGDGALLAEEETNI